MEYMLPGFFTQNRERFLVYAVHKNMMFTVNCKIRQKNKYEIKVFVFGN